MVHFTQKDRKQLVDAQRRILTKEFGFRPGADLSFDWVSGLSKPGMGVSDTNGQISSAASYLEPPKA